MRGDIRDGENILAFAPQIHRLIAECRKSCEAAEDADENECARFCREVTARFSELRKETNGEAADQIDGQRAVRKVDAAAPSLDKAAH